MNNDLNLIKALNAALADEWATVIRYTYHASIVQGFTGLVLRDFYANEINSELEHARFLTQMIVDLGGEPTTTPKEFPRLYSLEAILNYDLQEEQNAIQHYKHHAGVAGELGNIELQVKLEEMAAEESEHAREIRRLMRGIQTPKPA